MINMDNDGIYGVQIIESELGNFASVFKESSSSLFDDDDITPVPIKKGYRGYVPWGPENKFPYRILDKIGSDETMSSNMLFNTSTAYGRGLVITENGKEISTNDIKTFFRRSNMVKILAEQITDLKYFSFTILVVILNKEGTSISRIRHREAINCRFETCNPKNGKVENIFLANWDSDSLNDNDIEAIQLLDEDDPIGDLLVRMGKEYDPHTGEKENTLGANRTFAIVVRLPTPGKKYYPIAPYYSTFRSGWYDVKAAIPIAKRAKMRNGMQLKYMVELHERYFPKMFESEHITDPVKQKERKTLELKNIKDFLSGIENGDKSWFSTYYIDPNGKENKMVRIERIGGEKEGGDWIEDSEEASNIVSYSQGVHPSLIGSSPGSNKSINGTEARELFTMKQAIEKLPRDLLLQPYYVISEVNGWNLDFDIPDLMLTTLDQKTDAKETTQKTQQNAS